MLHYFFYYKSKVIFNYLSIYFVVNIVYSISFYIR
nr:MAG TPA: hypothetical protein [Caudoviricetes sp.]